MITTGKKIYKSKISTILPHNIPLIFWDTCGLLKILHIPECKENECLNVLHNFEWVLEKINNDELISVTSDMVLTELNQHCDNVVKNLVNCQNNAKKEILKFSSLEIDVKVKRNTEAQLKQINVEKRLLKLMNSILQKTYIVKEHRDFQNNAHYRVTNKIAPANAKSEYKDCYIWITFVTVIHILPNVKSMFFTDNKKDFLNGGTPQNCIENDFTGKDVLVSNQIGDSRKLFQH